MPRAELFGSLFPALPSLDTLSSLDELSKHIASSYVSITAPFAARSAAQRVLRVAMGLSLDLVLEQDAEALSFLTCGICLEVSSLASCTEAGKLIAPQSCWPRLCMSAALKTTSFAPSAFNLTRI